MGGLQCGPKIRVARRIELETELLGDELTEWVVNNVESSAHGDALFRFYTPILARYRILVKELCC